MVEFVLIIYQSYKCLEWGYFLSCGGLMNSLDLVSIKIKTNSFSLFMKMKQADGISYNSRMKFKLTFISADS